MSVIISIDGACRRNGKPDCVSAGGLFIVKLGGSKMQTIVSAKTMSVSEKESTNQRGEMLALLEALKYFKYETNGIGSILTDSEYLFNTMHKEWFKGWKSRGWLTAQGTTVKNLDLWQKIVEVYEQCDDVVFFHIKGHCIPFGKVTAENLLLKDASGIKLCEEVYRKYDAEAPQPKRLEKLMDAQELSLKNNGFKLQAEHLRNFVVLNIVVDAVANKAVEEADCKD